MYSQFREGDHVSDDVPWSEGQIDFLMEQREVHSCPFITFLYIFIYIYVTIIIQGTYARGNNRGKIE